MRAPQWQRTATPGVYAHGHWFVVAYRRDGRATYDRFETYEQACQARARRLAAAAAARRAPASFPAAERPSRPGWIYFAQGADGGPIKIGYTATHPRQRLAELQCGSPTRLVLLGAVRGMRAEELLFHIDLAEDRLHGEWFSPSESVLGFIAGLPDHPRGLTAAELHTTVHTGGGR